MTFWKTAWAVAVGLLLAQLVSIVFALAAFVFVGTSLLAALHP